MIKWSNRGRSGSFENDDIRRSLEMLDDILAEYEQDGDVSNCRSSLENYSYNTEATRGRRMPPPPPEEAARVLVSLFPRYQNGTSNPTAPSLALLRGEEEEDGAEDFPPPPPERELNADACNNNSNKGYGDCGPSLAQDNYDYEGDEKQKPPPVPKRSPTAKLAPATSSTSESPTNNRNYIESHFPEFPGFQLRMTGEGGYYLDDLGEDESILEVTYSLDVTDDYQFRAGYLDESGDSEDRSSEECSSVIEIPLAYRTNVVASAVGQPSSSVACKDQGEASRQEDDEDDIDVSQELVYLGDEEEEEPRNTCYRTYSGPESLLEPQKVDHCLLVGEVCDAGGTVFAVTGQLESNGSVGGDLIPPPPLFESPTFSDKSPIRDLPSSTSSRTSTPRSSKKQTTPDYVQLHNAKNQEGRIVENGYGQHQEPILPPRRIISVPTQEYQGLTNGEVISPQQQQPLGVPNTKDKYGNVQKMLKDGSLEGMDEAPPLFKPPPPPSNKQKEFGSQDWTTDDDYDDDDDEGRWCVRLPPGKTYNFGTTILLVNPKRWTDSSTINTVESYSGASKIQGDAKVECKVQQFSSQDNTATKSNTTTAARPTRRPQHERRLSAELLGLEKLPDVRSLVNTFNKKEALSRVGSISTRERAPLERRMSQEYVSSVRRELPIFTPNKEPALSGIAPIATLRRRDPNRQQQQQQQLRGHAASGDASGRTGSTVPPNYGQMNGEHKPTNRMATLPRPSHDGKKTSASQRSPGDIKSGATSQQQQQHGISASGKNVDTLRRTPPPPPPLSKGPPPKIFVEVQPSRSESSCTGSCSCLCMKHQSPCSSPVPPPMPSHKLAEIIKNDLRRAPKDSDSEASVDDQGRGKNKGRVNGQPKKPRRGQPQQPQQQQATQQQQQQQQQQQHSHQHSQQHPQQHPQQTLPRSLTTSDKIHNEPYDALILEIQAAIQRRKGTDGQDENSSECSEITSTPKMPALPTPSPNPAAHTPAMEKDKSLGRRGLFKGLWRRGKTEDKH